MNDQFICIALLKHNTFPEPVKVVFVSLLFLFPLDVTAVLIS